MEASIVDLRYNMKRVLRSIERNESVTILYRGKKKAVLMPAAEPSRSSQKVADHPFFGMSKDQEPVEEVMDRLRGGRCRDL